MSNERIEFDAVVVGAGLAGSAAAMVMARKGLNVALIERGHKPGGKNYFGGAIYAHAIAEVLPDFMDRKPPFERPVTEAGFWFLARDGLTRMTVQGGELEADPADAYITLRANFDLWWAEQAQEAGALLIPKTTVVDFIRDNSGQVIGVATDRPQGETTIWNPPISPLPSKRSSRCRPRRLTRVLALLTKNTGWPSRYWATSPQDFPVWALSIPTSQASP